MSNSTSNATATAGGGCGCLFFGVTWNGKHHSAGCSCDKGVVVQ